MIGKTADSRNITNFMENNKILKVFASVFAVFAIVYLGVLTWNAIKAHDYIGISQEQRHSIIVSGEGESVGVPDIAKIQLGHSVEKATVALAQKDNTEKMNGLIKKLKDDFKIDEKDIKTTNYNVTAIYDWPNGRQVLRGYQVNQNLEVKLRDVDKVSQVLEAAGQLSLNQIGGLSFEVDDQEGLKQEARIKAIRAAKLKAEGLAEVAGVKLGRIISFNESGNQPVPAYYDSSYKTLGMGGASSESRPEIQAGTAEIKITATVEYEIL